MPGDGRRMGFPPTSRRRAVVYSSPDRPRTGPRRAWTPLCTLPPTVMNGIPAIPNSHRDGGTWRANHTPEPDVVVPVRRVVVVPVGRAEVPRIVVVPGTAAHHARSRVATRPRPSRPSPHRPQDDRARCRALTLHFTAAQALRACRHPWRIAGAPTPAVKGKRVKGQRGNYCPGERSTHRNPKLRFQSPGSNPPRTAAR